MPQMTKQTLANSLTAFLQKKALSKITIKDIVDDCGVNRQSFYYHFQGVDGLVDWIFHSDLESLDYFDKNDSIPHAFSKCVGDTCNFTL